MSGIAERLAMVVSGHAYDTGWRCSCGWTGTADEYDAHLAQALLPVVEREIAAARGEALREMARDEALIERAQELWWKRGGQGGWPPLLTALAAALSPDPDRGEGEVAPRTRDHKPDPDPVLDLSRMGYGICPKCHQDKFIGHGPLCWECFTGSNEGQR